MKYGKVYSKKYQISNKISNKIPAGFFNMTRSADTSALYEKELKNKYILQLWIDHKNPEKRESNNGQFIGSVIFNDFNVFKEIKFFNDNYSDLFQWLQIMELKYKIR